MPVGRLPAAQTLVVHLSAGEAAALQIGQVSLGQPWKVLAILGKWLKVVESHLEAKVDVPSSGTVGRPTRRTRTRGELVASVRVCNSFLTTVFPQTKVLL